MKDSIEYKCVREHKLATSDLVVASVVGALVSFCVQTTSLFTEMSTVTALSTAFASAVVGMGLAEYWHKNSAKEVHDPSNEMSPENATAADADKYAILPCLRERRSIFPNEYDTTRRDINPLVIKSLLNAALWSPWHGKCKGCPHPAKFVVLGRKAMVEMQIATLQYYDRNWTTVGWGSGKHGTEEEYKKWRAMTHGEITGRWGPCSYMIAIVMQRQSGPTRLPEWEEAAATATAVHNLHLQSTKFPSLACYWSSWHEAMRESAEMKDYLKMGPEDKCMGFFIVAQVKPGQKDRRRRDPSLLKVEWRE